MLHGSGGAIVGGIIAIVIVLGFVLYETKTVIHTGTRPRQRHRRPAKQSDHCS
jgi:hypothetical protein